MDINKMLFTRTAPKKKMEIVRDLSTSELLSTSIETIRRMVRETGSRLYATRDKQLRPSESAGNDWNSTFLGVRSSKKEMLADLYIQYANTDTERSVPVTEFLKMGSFTGSIISTDRYGNPQTHYYTYSEEEKAECIKGLLLEYLNRKYKDKLS